jgi:hypothetical protein
MKAKRRGRGTEAPKINASSDDAGIPTSALRRSARFT